MIRRTILFEDRLMKLMKIDWEAGAFIKRHSHSTHCRFKITNGMIYHTTWYNKDSKNNSMLWGSNTTHIIPLGQSHEMFAPIPSCTLHLYTRDLVPDDQMDEICWQLHVQLLTDGK